jgi:hypothetical protein
MQPAIANEIFLSHKTNLGFLHRCTRFIFSNITQSVNPLAKTVARQMLCKCNIDSDY